MFLIYIVGSCGGYEIDGCSEFEIRGCCGFEIDSCGIFDFDVFIEVFCVLLLYKVFWVVVDLLK